MFTVFDLFSLGTILLCMVISATRGMVSELFDFGGWIISLILARMLATSVAASVFPSMQPRAMAVVCSFVLVFVVARLLQSLLRFALNSAINKAKLTSLNRMMGGLLGTLKGILFVGIAVFACSFSNLPRTPEWQDAATAEFFETLVKASAPYLPEILADQVHFPQRGLSDDLPEQRRRKRNSGEVERLVPRGY